MEPTFLQTFLNVDIMKEVGPYILTGLLTTLKLSALVIPLGMASGLLLALLGFVANNRLVRALLVV